MSEFLTAAASTMKVPEALVRRSAEARSKAAGSSVDEILQAWAGGEAAPAAVSPVAAPEAPSEAAAPVESTPAPQPASELAPVESPVAVMVIEEEPETDPVEPVPLRVRTKVAGRFGMGYGLAVAVLVMVVSAQWLLPRTGAMPGEGVATEFAFAVNSGWMIVGSALIGLAVGALGAGFIRLVTGWHTPGMRLVSSHAVTVVMGALGGLVTGAVVASVLVGAGVPDPVEEGVTLIPVVPAVLWTLFLWVAGGWMIGAAVHAVGVPDGLDEAASEEGTTVRRRLTAAFGLPVASLLAILLLVLPAAFVFIQFPAWAPLIAIFIAGGILAFAGMSAARPGMRITTGEFLAAVGGIAVVVVIIASVLLVQGASGH